MRFHAERLTSLAAIAVAAAIAATAGDAAADPTPLRSARPGRIPTAEVLVFVSPPAPAESAMGSGSWQVFLWSNGKPEPLGVKSAVLATDFVNNRLVTLTLDRNLTSRPERLDVVFSTASGERSYVSYQAPSPPKPSPRLVKAEKREDADVYFEGIVAPAAGSRSKYTIDALANYTFKEFEQAATLEVESEFKVDEKPGLDPDSIRAGVTYTRIGTTQPETWLDQFNLRWQVAGVELEKTGDVVNLVSAVSLLRPFVGRTYYTNADGERRVATTTELDLAVAVEAGGNLQNAATVALAGRGRGTGAILRLVPSARFYFLWRSVPFGEGVNFSAHVESRVLARDELFLETRDDPENPVALLNGKLRTYATAEAEFMVHEFVGLTAGYEYGSLPPTFKFVDHKGSIGVVLKFKWQ